MAASSQGISAFIRSAPRPSSATPTAHGKKAVSKTPSDGCADTCRAKPTSTNSPPDKSRPPPQPTTIPLENASTSIPPPRHSKPNCCTSNVNPHSRFRGNDEGERRHGPSPPPPTEEQASPATCRRRQTLAASAPEA